MLSIKVAHIAPIGVVYAVFAGTARVLKPGGHLFLCAPFANFGQELSDGNEQFGQKLWEKDPS